MLSFVGSLPVKNLFVKALEEYQIGHIAKFKMAYQQKSTGLVFLHALTLFRLAFFAEVTEREVLDNFAKNLESSFQIDAKMCLSLMSRRPFSKMLEDVKIENYHQMFSNFMENNTIFREQIVHFKNLNYGLQLITPTGKPQNLSYLAEKLDTTFYDENTQVIDKLLKQGVVTTLMLRKLKLSTQYIFKNYLDDSIKSVEHPTKRYIIDLETDYLIMEVSSAVDVLSPPHFLPLSDSMGKYHDALAPEDLKEYGEAIIELRNVRNLGSCFFEISRLNKEKQTQFLCDYKTIEQDSLKLFDFLYSFNEDQRDLVYLLMSHEVRRTCH